LERRIGVLLSVVPGGLVEEIELVGVLALASSWSLSRRTWDGFGRLRMGTFFGRDLR
jgi:hypothetical protein